MGKYRSLGNSFDKTYRNDLNANFDDIDKDIKSQKTRVDNLIQNAPQPSEVVDIRQGVDGVVHPTAKERIDTEVNSINAQLAKTENLATEALVKADNPLTALSASGYKLQLSDLSEEVISAMAGTTPITDSKGLINNSGVDFPLRKVVRNSVFDDIHADLKNSILDFKVINAKKDKYYRLQWLGNGTTTFGDPSYQFIITEHDKNTFATSSETSVIRHVDRTDYNFSQPTGITTRYLESRIDDTFFVVTIDYSKLITYTVYDLNNNGGSKVGYSSVIDESCYIYKTYKEVLPKPLVCQKNGNTHRVKFKYSDTMDLVLDFDLLGINQITHLKRVYRQINKTKYPLPNFTSAILWYEINTDWVSPYGIIAKNNIVNPSGAFTVGGNHGTDNNGGFATARRISTEMYADNQIVNDGETVYADKIIIKTINAISASNAIDLANGNKRDSVYEYVVYTITPNNVEVSVMLEALEDVDITRYAGLQAGKSAYNLLYFMLDKGALTYNISTTPSSQINSGNRTEANVDRFILKNTSDLLIAYMDRTVGIGDLSYFATGSAMAYYTTANKAYLHNVSSRIATLTPSQNLYYRGGYTFAPPLECVGAESAYIIKFGGKSTYVVDFIGSADTILKTLPTDIGKKITIVEKSETITCDSFITSKGLKVSSTGYGQLKFITE